MAKISSFLNKIYQKLFKIDDTPGKISLGFGLGVFVGVLPGTGPIVAVVLATFFRINRASALIGSLLTNTWISAIVAILSLKVGPLIVGEENFRLYFNAWKELASDFNWHKIFHVSTIKILIPALIGYFLISLIMGLFSYVITLTILKIRRNKSSEIK